MDRSPSRRVKPLIPRHGGFARTRPPRSLFPSVLAIAVLATLTACGDASAPGVPHRLVIFDGNLQEGTAKEALLTPLTALVLDGQGAPVVGTPVRWAVIQGRGTVDPEESMSDAQGRAQTRFTLGSGLGPNEALAAVDGVEPVVFRATATTEPEPPEPEQLCVPSLESVCVSGQVFQNVVNIVHVGTKVTWTWVDDESHNITFHTGGGPNAPTVQGKGFKFQRTFTLTGNYEYYCTIHGTPTTGQRGIISVIP